MVGAANNQILHINIKGIGYIIKRFKVWLNRITTPFTYGTIGFSNLFCKPFSGFLLFSEYYFKSIQISHRIKCFNHGAKLYNLSDTSTTSYNNYYQEVEKRLKQYILIRYSRQFQSYAVLWLYADSF